MTTTASEFVATLEARGVRVGYSRRGRSLTVEPIDRLRDDERAFAEAHPVEIVAVLRERRRAARREAQQRRLVVPLTIDQLVADKEAREERRPAATGPREVLFHTWRGYYSLRELTLGEVRRLEGNGTLTPAEVRSWWEAREGDGWLMA